MKKRVISAILAGVMVMSTLTGCGDSQNTTNASTATETTKETGSEATTSESEVEVEADGPLFKEPVELSILYSTSVDTSEDLILQEVLKATNVDADLILTPQASYDEKLNSILASGELPDIVYLSEKQMNTWVEEGALIALDDLIEEYGQNIKNALDESDYTVIKNVDDGKIYGVPYLLKIPAQYAWGIRRDWLEQLNLEMPKDLESLEKVLTAFKDNAATLGVENLIPMVGNVGGSVGPFSGLYECFGFSSYGESCAWTLDADGNYISRYEHPNYEAFLETAARWYQNGLIDPEYLSRTFQDIHTLFNSGLAGCGYLYSTRLPSVTASVQEIDPDGYLEYMEPIVGYDGTQRVTGRVAAGARACITIAAEDKAIECIKYLDWFYSEEGDRLLNFGIEGLSYDMVDDAPVINDEYNQGWEAIRAIGGVSTVWAYNRNLDAYYQCMLYGKDVEECEEVDLLTYRAYTGNEPYIVSPLRAFSTETSKAKGTEIYAMLAEAEAKVINGSYTIEDFRKVLAKAKEYGLDAMTTEMQAYWDKVN
ncbi:MAG: extracellular solute-binding protein [Lachnospiraceae bacterium]|nr:extracellular solute-binding protein [Lachnospiraceae bacterium]